MASIKRHWSQPDRKPFDKSLLTPNNPRAHPDLRVKDRSNLQEIRTRVRALRDELEIMKKRGKMCIEEIGYDFDKERLLDEALRPDGYGPFVDPKNGKVSKDWLIKREVDHYAKTITEDFATILETKVKPRFYIQTKGFTVPWHQDRGTQSAINFVLTTSRDPIEFRHRVYRYRTAIIDVQQEHQVTATTEDRVLFKLSLPDMDFDTARRKFYKYCLDNDVSPSGKGIHV